MGRILAILCSVIGAGAVAVAVWGAGQLPSALWARTVFSATIGLLLVANLGAVLGRDSARAFWIGTVLFGWTYLLLACSDRAARYLSTVDLFDYVLYQLQVNRMVPGDLLAPDVHQVGHSLFALVLALIGGLLARSSCGRSSTEVRV